MMELAFTASRRLRNISRPFSKSSALMFREFMIWSSFSTFFCLTTRRCARGVFVWL